MQSFIFVTAISMGTILHPRTSDPSVRSKISHNKSLRQAVVAIDSYRKSKQLCGYLPTGCEYEHRITLVRCKIYGNVVSNEFGDASYRSGSRNKETGICATFEDHKRDIAYKFAPAEIVTSFYDDISAAGE